MKKLQLYTLLLIILCACSKEDDTGTVLNGNWKLESIEDGFIENSPNDEEITISFENDVYTGRTEVNQFGGDYSVAKDSLSSAIPIRQRSQRPSGDKDFMKA